MCGELNLRTFYREIVFDFILA
ncbi:hypothetical protein R5R35_010049 [Gryllus longicercus]|uniref:Uncharacterized protein n=1 Tax=Gryllus longicercus TaxID=2509291 RepID=A0AAN9VCH5_9ORTH